LHTIGNMPWWSRAIRRTSRMARWTRRFAAFHGTVVFFDVPFGLNILVAMLDEQPFFFAGRILEANQYKAPVQFLPVQNKFDFPAIQLLRTRERAFNRIGSVVPEDHFTRAIIPFGNCAFESSVVQRVIFSLDGETPVLRLPVRGSGLRPGGRLRRYSRRESMAKKYVQHGSGTQ
jgi:hypothetical protein